MQLDSTLWIPIHNTQLSAKEHFFYYWFFGTYYSS